MQRAAEFYGWHVETYDESLTSYARFFSSEFLWFLADRGWGSLSFADLAHRYRYFSAFDLGVAAKKNDFEMIRRICLLQEVESSP